MVNKFAAASIASAVLTIATYCNSAPPNPPLSSGQANQSSYSYEAPGKASGAPHVDTTGLQMADRMLDYDDDPFGHRHARPAWPEVPSAKASPDIEIPISVAPPPVPSLTSSGPCSCYTQNLGISDGSTLDMYSDGPYPEGNAPSYERLKDTVSWGTASGASSGQMPPPSAHQGSSFGSDVSENVSPGGSKWGESQKSVAWSNSTSLMRMATVLRIKLQKAPKNLSSAPMTRLPRSKKLERSETSNYQPSLTDLRPYDSSS